MVNQADYLESKIKLNHIVKRPDGKTFLQKTKQNHPRSGFKVWVIRITVVQTQTGVCESLVVKIAVLVLRVMNISAGSNRPV